MASSRPAAPGLLLQQNIKHLYGDIAWFGVLSGTTMAFLAIYMARRGGSPFQIGLLTAGPGVVNLFLSLPTGQWLEKQTLVPTTFWSSVLMRIGYALLVPLPFLFSPAGEVWAIVGITLLMSIPGTILAISFNAMFADLVPPEWRSQVVGRRNALLAITMTISVLVCGKILDVVPEPTNYQIVFAVGAAGALLSSYHLSRLCPEAGSPTRLWRPLGDLAWPGILRAPTGALRPGLRFLTRSQGKSLLRLDLLRSSFGLFLLAYGLFYTFQYVSIPIFPIYYVDALHLSDGTIGLGSAMFYVMMMLFSLWSQSLSIRRGHRFLLASGGFFYGLYPLILYLAKGEFLFYVASVSGGAVWGLLNATLLNRLMERVPENDRPAHMALHNLVLNIGILLGSLIGPAFASSLGSRDALLAGGLLRILGGLLLLIWG